MRWESWRKSLEVFEVIRWSFNRRGDPCKKLILIILISPGRWPHGEDVEWLSTSPLLILRILMTKTRVGHACMITSTWVLCLKCIKWCSDQWFNFTQVEGYRRICGNQNFYPDDAPRTGEVFRSEGNSLTVHFVTDYSNNGEFQLPFGFVAHYYEEGKYLRTYLVFVFNLSSGS